MEWGILFLFWNYFSFAFLGDVCREVRSRRRRRRRSESAVANGRSKRVAEKHWMTG